MWKGISLIIAVHVALVILTVTACDARERQYAAMADTMLERETSHYLFMDMID